MTVLSVGVTTIWHSHNVVMFHWLAELCMSPQYSHSQHLITSLPHTPPLTHSPSTYTHNTSHLTHLPFTPTLTTHASPSHIPVPSYTHNTSHPHTPLPHTYTHNTFLTLTHLPSPSHPSLNTSPHPHTLPSHTSPHTPPLTHLPHTPPLHTSPHTPPLTHLPHTHSPSHLHSQHTPHPHTPPCRCVWAMAKVRPLHMAKSLEELNKKFTHDKIKQAAPKLYVPAISHPPLLFFTPHPLFSSWKKKNDDTYWFLSVTYLDCIVTFKALYCWIFVRNSYVWKHQTFMHRTKLTNGLKYMTVCISFNFYTKLLDSYICSRVLYSWKFSQIFNFTHHFKFTCACNLLNNITNKLSILISGCEQAVEKSDV